MRNAGDSFQVFLAITRGVEFTSSLLPAFAIPPSTIFITNAIVTQVDAFIPLVVQCSLCGRLQSFVSGPLSVVPIFIFICSVSV